MARFYKHYKDKPYCYLGVPKFSETLEEMVVYETLYENSEGPLWVRPRAMFEETVERGGQVVPRFRAVPFDIKRHTSLDSLDLADVTVVANKVLRPISASDIVARLKPHSQMLVQVCYLDGIAAGFKIGYAQSDARFYSWLGGVDPAFQRLGVATALIEDQHQWCREHGFTEVETRTSGDASGMLILNVRSGFRVTGTMPASDGSVKVVLVKSISRA